MNISNQKKSSSFEELFSEAKNNPTYWIEESIITFTEEVTRLMSELDISKAELSRLLNKKPPYITRILKGNTNLTLETMVLISQALNCKLDLHLTPKNNSLVWFEYQSQKHLSYIESEQESPKSLDTLNDDSDRYEIIIPQVYRNYSDEEVSIAS